MKCGRLQLWDRRSIKRNNSTIEPVQSERPRRYCQQKMVNPNHEEESRWAESKFERFQCEQRGVTNNNCVNESDYPLNKPEEDKNLYLTVLNLKFPGDCLKSKFMRSSFKYKMPSAENCNAHRMFVKQPVVDEIDVNSCTCNEFQSEYKLDDYVKNILNGNDTPRPPTSVSGFLNQIPIIDHQAAKEATNENILESRDSIESEENGDTANTECRVDDVKTTVKYQSTGKRRSLTISRAQSPESVQVIRVDVICNYSGRSSVSSFTDTRDKVKLPEEKYKPTKDFIDSMKHRAAYTNKYILTNTLKQLDETIDNGDKVTLLCKTYKLASRSNPAKNTSDFRNDVSANKMKAKV